MAKKNDTNMSTSDFNLTKVTTKNLPEHIACSIAAKSNIMIFGRRGSGKTEIAKQQIKKAGAKEVYINLSVLERVDLGGYPDFSKVDVSRRFVDFLLPRFYEPMLEGETHVVALLDEVDKAAPELWAPLLELTQFKSINGRELPNLHSVIMTGNLISEGGSRPSPPLLDRAEKYLVEPDVDAWLDWSGSSGAIHPAMLAYIKDTPQDLFGPVDPDDRYADPSPRGWAQASRIVWAGEKLGWSTDMLNAKVSGCVGKAAGIKYYNYYEHYQVLLPLVEDIFNGEKGTKEKYSVLPPSKKIVACFMVFNRLASHLDSAKEKKIQDSLSKVGDFITYIEPENALISIRTNIQVDRIMKHGLTKHEKWEPVLKKMNARIRGRSV